MTSGHDESAVTYDTFRGASGVPVKAWTRGVPVEDAAKEQLLNVAQLAFVFRWVAAMPDVHWGIGATVGSVIATKGAIIPAAVGVDIGCGMMATRTTLTAADLPDNLRQVRHRLERAIPHGRSHHGGREDQGAWARKAIPAPVEKAWKRTLSSGFRALVERFPSLERSNHITHLGTLGTGNHFVELCLDEADRVWLMLHSGSRGVGNAIGRHFIALARKDMERHLANLPDQDLAYFEEGSEHFGDYVGAVGWAQRYARANREIMMQHALEGLRKARLPKFEVEAAAVNCHHNYVAHEEHYGQQVYVTRKGAVRAGAGELGIIPGSMGARSYIVEGLGNPESFHSCSHGAGRKMSRTKARKLFSLDDHATATAHVECRKDEGVLDETPGAYKDIDAVMRAQADLVAVRHTLRQVVCVKG